LIVPTIEAFDCRDLLESLAQRAGRVARRETPAWMQYERCPAGQARARERTPSHRRPEPIEDQMAAPIRKVVHAPISPSRAEPDSLVT